MTRLVQVAMAGDVTEAEELQTILRSAGIDSELEVAVVHDPLGTDDVPQKVMVPEDAIEAAQRIRAEIAALLPPRQQPLDAAGGQVDAGDEDDNEDA